MDQELVTIYFDNIRKGNVNYSFLDDESVVSVKEPIDSFKKCNMPCIPGAKFFTYSNSGMVFFCEYEIMKKVLEERSIYLR
jgi:hypothetical protein